MNYPFDYNHIKYIYIYELSLAIVEKSKRNSIDSEGIL